MKKKLRNIYLSKRNELDKSYREDVSNNIFSKIEQLEIFKNSNTIFIYINFGSEIITTKFIKKWITKKVILVPKIVNNNMVLVNLKKFEDLEISKFGILEPKNNDIYLDECDLVITPSVAYNKDGYRIGYGAGYYDKYFSKEKYKYSIGVAYENNMITEKVIWDEYDIPVDMLITESRVRMINDKFHSDNKC